MTKTEKQNQLSLRESGEYDKKFHLAVNAEGHVTQRKVTTGWTLVCLTRAVHGVSRKARIALKKRPVVTAEETV